MKRFQDFLESVIQSGVKAVALKKSTEWAQIVCRAKRLYKYFSKKNEVSVLPFAYIRGVVAEAIEMGYWLLVDEINLAPMECLDAIVQVCYKYCFKL